MNQQQGHGTNQQARVPTITNLGNLQWLYISMFQDPSLSISWDDMTSDANTSGNQTQNSKTAFSKLAVGILSHFVELLFQGQFTSGPYRLLCPCARLPNILFARANCTCQSNNETISSLVCQTTARMLLYMRLTWYIINDQIGCTARMSTQNAYKHACCMQAHTHTHLPSRAQTPAKQGELIPEIFGISILYSWYCPGSHAVIFFL